MIVEVEDSEASEWTRPRPGDCFRYEGAYYMVVRGCSTSLGYHDFVAVWLDTSQVSGWVDDEQCVITTLKVVNQ